MNPTPSPEIVREASSSPTDKSQSETRFVILVFLGTLAVGLLAVVGFMFLGIKVGKPMQAKATMKGIEIAIKGYKTEYLRLPFPGASSPALDNPAYHSDAPDGNDLLDVLRGSKLMMNPRRARFWEPPPGSSGLYTPGIGLVDVWRIAGYRILLDYDKDGHIADPEGITTPIKADVLLYSAGPDGDFTSWSDNVCSWK